MRFLNGSLPRSLKMTTRGLVLLTIIIALSLAFRESQTRSARLQRIAAREAEQGPWLAQAIKRCKEIDDTSKPVAGARVKPDDPILKVNYVWLHDDHICYHSYVISNRGIFGDDWHYPHDAGGDNSLGTVEPARLDALPSLLAKLPPSDPEAVNTKILKVSFRKNGVWEVRRYRYGAVPPEVQALAPAIGFRGSDRTDTVERW